MTRKLNLDSFIPYRLSVASNAVSSAIADSYRKRFGLKIPEWRIIAILAEHAALTPQTLGEATRMDKITVSRAAAALLERGLVVAADNPADRRSHFLSLTRAGQQLYDEICPHALALEAEMLRAFAPNELEVLDSFLRRLEQATENILKVLVSR